MARQVPAGFRVGAFAALNNGAITGCVSDVKVKSKENSCGFAYDNNGKIRIQIEHGDHTILLTVIDNGGGLPVEVRENLFSRFYRAPNTTSGGTGLGLSIARAIAEKHHGTITADNLADGLRVTFCFPNVSDNLRNGYRE